MFRMSPNKSRIVFVAVITLLLISVLSVFVMYTVKTVDMQVTRSCFDDLTDTSKQLAASLYSDIMGDRTTLSAIATVIGNQDNMSDEAISSLLSTYDFEATYISYLEILRPDGTMLDYDGQIRDVTGAFDFSAEAAKGKSISDICISTRDGESKVVRQAVPIIGKSGDAIGILYGTVRLSDLPDRYTTDLFHGHAYVYIMDAETGDFLLDTWHHSLGNINEMGSRKTVIGHTLEESLEDMRNGIGGEVGFISRTTGGVLLMHYEPIGINKWYVMLSVEECYALEDSEAINAKLYLMATVIGSSLLLYVVCIVICMFGAYRQVQKLGSEDQSTGLLNRNMYDKYVSEHRKIMFRSVTCIYIDVNGLHSFNNKYGHSEGDKMLRTIADALIAEFDRTSLFRVGGDEFVVFSEKEDRSVCEEKMRMIAENIGEYGYSISFGVLQYTDEAGLDRIIHDSDELMLRNKRAYYEEFGKR